MKIPMIKACTAPGNGVVPGIAFGLLLVALLAIVLHLDSATAADAAPPESAQTLWARRVIADYLSTEQAQFATLPASLSVTDGLLQRCLADPANLQVPLAKVRADPFGLGASSESAGSIAASEKNSDAQRLTMLHDLQKLQLQSIVASGDHPQCMIDGCLYQVGDQIDTFTIERIDVGVVVVRNGGYRFELKIAS